ncbi:MAG: ribosome small subunit-dependent GTPase A [Mariprofundaceae bacterium]|nr:ribosome small subunit-dependent GTPase A [Mariprofundaceae bacterium]
MELKDLGLDSWFEQHAHDLCEPEQTMARVVAVDRGRYVVHTGAGEIYAELLGKFFYAAERADKFPCVGDWVCLEHHDSNHFASIHRVLPRKTLLQRKTVGYDEEFQILAANIDVTFIVMSCDYDFHVNKLERFLVMVHAANIEPVLIFTKTDIIDLEELEMMIEDIRDAGIKISILLLSNTTGDGLERLRQYIQPMKTYCLLGSSGVGKSTMMNQLIGEPIFETQEVSASGEGRHTTVRRHLIALKDGAMIVDMPGMRELAISEVSKGIEDSFEDIIALSQTCRFANCHHNHEPGCAIVAAIESDELNIEHYDNYLKIKKESGHHKQISFSERRKKGKNASRLAPSKVRKKRLKVFDEDLDI